MLPKFRYTEKAPKQIIGRRTGPITLLRGTSNKNAIFSKKNK